MQNMNRAGQGRTPEGYIVMGSYIGREGRGIWGNNIRQGRTEEYLGAI